jgi:hypothetical protein
MKIRELLRYEIWSKRTTRKILAAFSVVFVVLVLGFFAFHEIDLYWLTKGERAAAKAALQRVDALQNADSLSDEEFEARRKETESAIDAAERVAKTKKDQFTYFELCLCSMDPELRRMKAIEQRLVEQGKLHGSQDQWEWYQQDKIRTILEAHADCLDLHKKLD